MYVCVADFADIACVCVLCGDGFSVGHSQGAATANFLAGIPVGRSQVAANAFNLGGRLFD